ncbi:hypothetical protein DFR70_104496 [Nocardia tenerifensis]|uniref:Uncharacterized protein n=1 Tax=Nocardia tenerifensis TaxID=228006 RepID=A0A318K6Y0_9NOCA|nr:hypothetical protein DFR70_104496 [Nocardia tenerifensis]
MNSAPGVQPGAEFVVGAYVSAIIRPMSSHMSESL